MNDPGATSSSRPENPPSSTQTKSHVSPPSISSTSPFDHVLSTAENGAVRLHRYASSNMYNPNHDRFPSLANQPSLGLWLDEDARSERFELFTSNDPFNRTSESSKKLADSAKSIYGPPEHTVPWSVDVFDNAGPSTVKTNTIITGGGEHDDIAGNGEGNKARYIKRGKVVGHGNAAPFKPVRAAFLPSTAAALTGASIADRDKAIRERVNAHLAAVRNGVGNASALTSSVKLPKGRKPKEPAGWNRMTAWEQLEAVPRLLSGRKLLEILMHYEIHELRVLTGDDSHSRLAKAKQKALEDIADAKTVEEDGKNPNESEGDRNARVKSNRRREKLQFKEEVTRFRRSPAFIKPVPPQIRAAKRTVVGQTGTRTPPASSDNDSSMVVDTSSRYSRSTPSTAFERRAELTKTKADLRADQTRASRSQDRKRVREENTGDEYDQLDHASKRVRTAATTPPFPGELRLPETALPGYKPARSWGLNPLAEAQLPPVSSKVEDEEIHQMDLVQHWNVRHTNEGRHVTRSESPYILGSSPASGWSDRRKGVHDLWDPVGKPFESVMDTYRHNPMVNHTDGENHKPMATGQHEHIFNNMPAEFASFPPVSMGHDLHQYLADDVATQKAVEAHYEPLDQKINEAAHPEYDGLADDEHQ